MASSAEDGYNTKTVWTSLTLEATNKHYNNDRQAEYISGVLVVAFD